MTANYSVWCNLLFLPHQQEELGLLKDTLKDGRLFLFEPKDTGVNGEAAEALKQADIAFGNPDAVAAMNCENLKWVQTSSAGYSAYDRDDFRYALKKRGAIFTNSSDVFAEPCAQHLAAMILSIARGLPLALKTQMTTKAWTMHALRPQLKLPNGQTIVILGFGAIGRRLAELLAPFEMNVIGVKRTVHGGEPIKVIEASKIDEVLPLADHVVNILPASAENDGFFDASRLRSLKKGAILYNIGRGTTIDQHALIAELEVGHIAAAYLDVTDPEPLPSEHPLWSTPNCYITPHIGGGLHDERKRQVMHFLQNFQRFKNSESLLNRIF